MTELIETAPYEFTVNYNFANGLDPYFAFDAVVKQHNGSTISRFEYNGEPWEVTLYYQDSGIVNPGEVTPYGTPFGLDELREFRLSVESARDSVGQRSFNVHIRPRWDGMTVENDQGGENQLNVPFDEGVNVKIAGSNIEFREYLNLLQEGASALSIGRSYFTDPHESSNVQQAERYVRRTCLALLV